MHSLINLQYSPAVPVILSYQEVCRSTSASTLLTLHPSIPQVTEDKCWADVSVVGGYHWISRRHLCALNVQFLGDIPVNLKISIFHLWPTQLFALRCIFFVTKEPGVHTYETRCHTCGILKWFAVNFFEADVTPRLRCLTLFCYHEHSLPFCQRLYFTRIYVNIKASLISVTGWCPSL